MAKNVETIVKVIGIIAIVFGGLSALAGLGLLFGASFMGFMMSGFGLLGGMGAVLGLFVIAYGIVEIFAGINVMKYNNTARIFLLVVSILGVLSFPIGTAWAVFVWWGLMFDKDIKAKFK